jgi:MoaA/NifB/PqqE/SkfB family radical SAM enzyme
MPGASPNQTARLRVDSLRAPLLVSWQITRDCDLACLHCCTGSAPGKRLPDELSADEAFRLADDIIREQVPYVMLCGGEPLEVPHFLALAERLGHAGVQLKIETNGQRLDRATAERLARLPVRSIQISLDGESQASYGAQRPGGSLEKAHAACQAVRDAGMPLEVTFAPTRLNIHEVEAVIGRAALLGAFRFNTGRLMRIGTAARLWDKLEPTADEYRKFRESLDRIARAQPAIELCYTPFSVEDGLRGCLREPPATLLVLPNGWTKVAAALPYLCGDLRRHTLAQCWTHYRAAWRDETITNAANEAIQDGFRHTEANDWRIPMVANI